VVAFTGRRPGWRVRDAPCALRGLFCTHLASVRAVGPLGPPARRHGRLSPGARERSEKRATGLACAFRGPFCTHLASVRVGELAGAARKEARATIARRKQAKREASSRPKRARASEVSD